jgi:hypothetical protein
LTRETEELLEHLPPGARAVRVKRVAELLDCSKNLVYELIRSGDLQAIQLTHSKRPATRVLVSSIEELLGQTIEENEKAPRPLVKAPSSAAWAKRARGSR